jgi:acetylornithine deacetylase/succinyl-diaminopimelate desuccinylase-like protein
MKNSPMNLFLFSFFSILTFSGLIYTNSFTGSLGQRDISSISAEDVFVDPVTSGALCAEELEKIGITEGWEKDQNTNEQIQKSFSICLSEYIKIKTVSPAGNEEQAVLFLEQIFKRLDYPYKKIIVEDLTGINNHRENIIATVPHDLSRNYDWSVKPEVESVILLNHMDVVDAIPSQWESPDLAWSGKITGSADEPNRDFIWGRGALDMKGIGITQIIAMQILRAKNEPLSRDVHFLAVADEEQSGSGAIGVIRQMGEGKELHALSRTALILNEGGGGIEKTPSDKTNLFLIAVEEKGGAWMDLKQKSPQKLFENLNKAKILDVKPYLKKRQKFHNVNDCKISKIKTPGSKVNVIASKIIVTLDCPTNLDISGYLKTAFTKNFKGISAELEEDGDFKTLTVESKSASHGSLGVNESAIDAVAVGLHRLGIIKLKRRIRKPKYFRYTRTDATKTFIKTLAKGNFVLKIAKNLQFIPFIKNLVLSEVEKEFGIDGLFRTTCQFSAINFDGTEASALVDCRLLHTAKKYEHSHEHGKDFSHELLKHIKDPSLTVDLVDAWNVSQSSTKSKDFKSILRGFKVASGKKLFRRSRSDGRVNLVTPYLFPAGTDSTWFRNPWSAGVSDVKSIPSYGFFPVFLTAELLGSFHGSDERFPVDQIFGTVVRYEAVLNELTHKRQGIIRRTIERIQNNKIERKAQKSFENK